MEPFQIHLYDWRRILFGDVPPIFFVELIIRVTFIYLLIIFSIRMMGKRMAAQLSRNEMVAISSLAASIGIPIQSPDRGLLPALIVAMIVVIAQRIISTRISSNEVFEKRSQGNIAILVDECCLQLKEMKRTRVSREELFARLRSENIRHLGHVKRLYFEAGGDFSLIRNPDKRSGLSILPDEDAEFAAEQRYDMSQYVCAYCARAKADHSDKCGHCDHDKFVHPAL